jgi:hypothetical protein
LTLQNTLITATNAALGIFNIQLAATSCFVCQTVSYEPGPLQSGARF